MHFQIEVLRQVQHQWHGPPKSIRCIKEYHNEQLRAFFAEAMTTLNLVAASDHDSNGLVENANQTLRSYYNRIRLCYRRSANEIILGGLYMEETS